MNTATLNTSTLGSNPSPSVNTALGELAGAAHRLVLALWASHSSPSQSRPESIDGHGRSERIVQYGR